MIGHIFFIMWVSGAGKWTLISSIQTLGREDIYIPLSYKTREKRVWEIHGVDAWFVSKEEFMVWVENGEFLEYALVHNMDYYGTKYEDVFQFWLDMWHMVLKELDIKWLQKIQKEWKLAPDLYTTIFLDIPTEMLSQRIELRWEKLNEVQLKNRMESATFERKHALKMCDYTIDAKKTSQEIFLEVMEIIHKKDRT